MAQPKYKLARCVKTGPPERTPEELKKLEKGFVLDCVSVSTLSDDSGRANPKMATAIPPYNGQKNIHSREYFEKKVVQRLLKKTDQVSLEKKCFLSSSVAFMFFYLLAAICFGNASLEVIIYRMRVE